MLLALALLRVAVSLTLCFPPVLASFAVKELHHVPSQWIEVGPAPAGHGIVLQIGLTQSRFSELERHLYEVSNPSHHRYGHHLTGDDVNELIKPKEEVIDQIHEWLLEYNITQSSLNYSPAKDWITVQVPVQTVEKLLDTRFSIFRHKDGSQVVRTLQWSLPIHLHDYVQTIQPTTSFFRPQSLRSTLKTVQEQEDVTHLSLASVKSSNNEKAPSSCNSTAVTSTCLRTLYGTLNYNVQSAANNSIGLTNFLGETNNRSDVNLYLEAYRPEAAAAAFNFTIDVISGGDDQQTPENSTQLAAGDDLEGNLDAETILGITWPTPLTAYNTGGSPDYLPDLLTVNNTNEPYLTWLQYILAQSDIPRVISISYGDDEQTVPYSYATAVCNAFAQLGARGVSVLVAGGDNGVGPDQDCFTNDGKNTATFLTGFPASCPYVTTVGATMDFNPEVVAHDAGNGFTSGGGFSNYFARPSYQDTAVTNYIENLGDQFKGLYNTSGRGYPDLSAQGFHYITIWNGIIRSLDGTSAATPTAASIISLLNDALLAAGKPVLGFLNPWIYSVANTSFTDVTVGSAIGCNTTGFPATQGWDAVTGFGTPHFPTLKDLVLGTSTSDSSLSTNVNLYTTVFIVILSICMTL